MKKYKKDFVNFFNNLVSFLFLCNYKVEATGEINEESRIYIFI